jgi:hypothetical protein
MKKISIILSIILTILYGCSDILSKSMALNESTFSVIDRGFLSSNGVNSTITISFSVPVDKSSVTLSGSMKDEASAIWTADDRLMISPSTSWSLTANGTLNIAVTSLSEEKISIESSYNIVNAVIAVHPNGNDANDGAKETPLRNIQTAIDSIASGVIIVAEGTYSQNYDFGGSDTPLVTLKDSVSLYGGYSSSAWNTRDSSIYVTKLIDTSTTNANITAKACAVFLKQE